MKRKVFKTVMIAVVLLAAGTYWASGGKTPVIYKPLPEPLESKAYAPRVLWPPAGVDEASAAGRAESPDGTEEAGAGSAVAVDSKGFVFYLHRAGYPYENDRIIPMPTVLQIDPSTGEVVGKWGAGYFKSPHGLYVDAKDQVWVTDVMLNKVFTFSRDGKLLREYGHDYPFYLEAAYRIKNVLPRLPLTRDPYIFARPTDIVVNEAGEFIVTDGYRNKRLVKFDAAGRMVWQINQSGSGPGELNLPHGVAMDAEGRLYVADRNNARIQVFSKEGQWLASWEQPEIGRPYGLEIGADQYLYVVDGGDYLQGHTAKPTSQVIKMDLEGRVIARWGSWGEKPGELRIPHDIAVDAAGKLYVAELMNNRLQQFTPIP